MADIHDTKRTKEHSNSKTTNEKCFFFYLVSSRLTCDNCRARIEPFENELTHGGDDGENLKLVPGPLAYAVMIGNLLTVFFFFFLSFSAGCRRLNFFICARPRRNSEGTRISPINSPLGNKLAIIITSEGGGAR